MAVRDPKHPKRNGRPMIPRERIGYDQDLGHLARLRSGCHGDSRLSLHQYRTISESITAIEKILRRLPKE